MEKKKILELYDIHKTFSMDTNPLNDKKALRGVSLTIYEGDFVSVIGSNGSGKSTLLNCIAGRFPIEEGSIILNGRELRKDLEEKRAKYIARVFQDPLEGTIASMSLFENLSIASRRGERQSPFRWALSKKKEVAFAELLKSLNLGLENRLNSPMGTFSGGQRQSITLLMATLKKPELLLLDEHTAALDPKTARTVMELTNQMVREHNIPTLMITHNMKDAIAYGNRLIMMNEGKIIFEAEGEEKKNLKVQDLIDKFNALGEGTLSDSQILAN